MSQHRLAPAAILRAAAWPLESLTRLAGPVLAERAAVLDGSDPEARRRFERAHADEIDRERAALWAMTASDARFRCGIALASATLHRTCGDGSPPARRNKRVRHRETSLYRYLARAVACPDPAGLWSSVSIASCTGQSQAMVEPCDPACIVAVELSPFRALLHGLEAREPYASRVRHRLNPTLQHDGDTWRYARRRSDGALEWRALPNSPLWPLLHRALVQRPPSTRADLARELARSLGEEAATAAISCAIELGLVVGGLTLPPRFHSPASALTDVEPLLADADRDAWQRARVRLDALCSDVARHLEDVWRRPSAHDPRVAAEQIVVAGDRTRDLVAALARELGVPPPELVGPPLRVDLSGAWRVRLGASDGAWLERAARRWDESATRHALVHVRADWIDQILGPRMERSISFAPEETSTAARARRAPPTVDAIDPGAPLSALIVRPGAEGLSHGWIRGMSDHPTATHARHAHHLARTGDPLTAWFREAFHELELRCGVRWVDIVLDAASSPNVVARPAYVDDMLDPWGASATGVAHLSLVRGGHPSVAFVRSGDRHLAAHVFTALAVPESDIVVERLLATSFASRALLGRAGSLRSRERREFIDQAASEPKLWVLDASDAKRLLQADAVGRYLEWQSLARAHGWPALVRVTIGAARSIAMPTTSPLALEAVLEGASAAGDAPAIHVEEVIEGGWLPGVDGRHVAELVVPLRREHHLWSHLEHDAAEVRCSS